MYSVSMISRFPILSTMVDNLSKITSHQEVQNNNSKVLLSHIKPDKLYKPCEYSTQTINEDITSHQHEDITSHKHKDITSHQHKDITSHKHEDITSHQYEEIAIQL